MSARKIKIVSIGSGWVATNRHMPTLVASEDFELVGIAGQQEQKLRAAAKKYDVPHIYTGDATKHADWLDTCEAVMIGASPQNHYKLVKFCLKNGKHVLVEKPFTLSIKESQELVKLAKDKDLTLCIVHNLQFADSAKTLDREIEAGKLGAINGVHGVQLGNHMRRLPTWYEELPWGLFFDESPHLMYLLDKYGTKLKPTTVTKVESTRGLKTPALVLATFKTGLGIPASLYLNFEAPLSEWFLFVYGDKRIGVLDIFRDIYYSLPNDGRHRARDILNTSYKATYGHLAGTLVSGLKEVTKTHRWGNDEIVARFARAIRTGIADDLISAKDALRVNKLQFAMIKEATVV